MGWSLPFLTFVAMATAPLIVQSTVVEGIANDAIAGENQSLLVTVAQPRRGLRQLSLPGPGRWIPAPEGSISVASCGQKREHLVFSTRHGLVDVNGQLLLGGTSLFVLPDPQHFYAAQLCGEAVPVRDELRLMEQDGIRIKRMTGDASTRLVWKQHSRMYSGRVHRGLRPARPYATATSMYAPHLVDGDLENNGTLDLIAEHEGRLAAYVRGPDGRVEATPIAEIDLHATSGGEGNELRVHFGDLDGDGRLDAVVGRAQGTLPKQSSAWWLRSTERHIFNETLPLWNEEGLVAPLSIVQRPRAPRDPHSGPAILATQVDTDLVTVGRVFLSGELTLPLRLRRLAQGGRSATVRPTRRAARAPRVTLHDAGGPEVVVQLDVRQMTTSGALPLSSVDLDGDGLTDLLDLGTEGRARVFRGQHQGFSDKAETYKIPAFVHVVPLPSMNTVVFFSKPENGKTSVSWLAKRRTTTSR